MDVVIVIATLEKGWFFFIFFTRRPPPPQLFTDSDIWEVQLAGAGLWGAVSWSAAPEAKSWSHFEQQEQRSAHTSPVTITAEIPHPLTVTRVSGGPGLWQTAGWLVSSFSSSSLSPPDLLSPPCSIHPTCLFVCVAWGEERESCNGCVMLIEEWA